MLTFQIGGSIVVVIFGIIGLILIILPSTSALDGMDDQDLIWLFYVCGFGLLVCGILAGLGVIFGAKLEKAARERDISKLESMYHIWIAMDVVCVILVVIFVLALQVYRMLIVVIALAVDVWRLTKMADFIKECKAGPGVYHAPLEA
jgi:dipeptide/tripeptide permease